MGDKNMMMRRPLLMKLAYILTLVFLMSCGSGSGNVGGQTGSVTAQLHWVQKAGSSVVSPGKRTATAPQGVVTVKIVVSGSDMSNVQKDFPASAGTGVIDGVPVGSNRTLTAQGLDSSGVVTHQGVTGNITVQTGQTADVGVVVMNPAGQTFTVSGRVTLNGSGLPNVTISLQGTSLSTVTGSDGTYSLPNVPNASYTVIPSLAGYTFTPANRSIPDGNGNVTGQDFAATLIPPQTHNISGRVTLNGSGLANVTISLQGTSLSAVTGSDGTYTINGVSNGAYTIIPSLAGFTFTPTNKPVSVNNGDVTGQDFTAVTQTHSISGRVTLNGNGLSGVTVVLDGTSLTAVTGSDGTYTINGVSNGAYTIIPSLAGFTFTPTNKPVSVNNGDVTGQDFTAVVQTANISGVWFLFHTQQTPQAGTEEGPEFIKFIQTGSSFTFTFVPNDGTSKTGSGTVSGNNVQLGWTDTDNCGNTATVSLTGVVAADGTINGSYTLPGSGSCGESGIWRTTKPLPPASDISGSWSVFPTVQGVEQGPVCETFTQAGNFLTFSGTANGLGIISANNIQLVFVSNVENCQMATEVTGTLTSASTISGNYTQKGNCGTSPGDKWRAVKGCSSPPLPNGFPTNVPAGNYRIDVSVCVQDQCVNGQSFTTQQSGDINQFAQSLVNALNTASAQEQANCSQSGVTCNFNVTYSQWDPSSSSFTITDNFSVTSCGAAACSTTSGFIKFTVTKI